MAGRRFKILQAIFCLSLISSTLCEKTDAKYVSKSIEQPDSLSKNKNETLEVAESKASLIKSDEKENLSKIELKGTLNKEDPKKDLEKAESKTSAVENLDVAESKNNPIKTDKPETLEEAESKDKLEIIKRIKKINNDGSYTIGYEADDGSFKIESRDVLGNVKGTYGFLDENGEIKRISYSTNNSSNIFSKPQIHPEVSVVQRIPKISIITPRPTFASSTQSPSSTTSSNVIQTIAKKRPLVLSSTTTQQPKYTEIRTTSKIHATASTAATPRILLQRTSKLTPIGTNKKPFEGQLFKPETISENPTQISLYHTIPNKKFIEDEKPVNEDPSDVRTNVLRRQLPHPHPENIKEVQSHNSAEDVDYYSYAYRRDTPDVYNTGMTEIVRPLFTTSGTPRKLFPVLSGTTSSPVLIPRPSRYPNLYQRGYKNIDESSNLAEQPVNYVTSTQAPSSPVPTIVPVVQIPANKPEIRYAQTPEEVKYAQSVTQRTINTNTNYPPVLRYDQSTTNQRTETQRYPQEQPHYMYRSEDPLVAIRHPFHRGAILVPLSQLQGNIIPIEDVREVHEARRNFVNRNQQEEPSATEVQVEKQKLLTIKNGMPPLRPVPVHVDENGFIREVPRNVQTPYPLPVPVTPNVPVLVAATPVPKYVTNEIDNIEPPVSTRDFQKLLHQLVLRQQRLEKLNELMAAKELYSNQIQPVLIRPVPKPVQGTPVPYVLRRVPQVPPQNYRTVEYEPQSQGSDVQQREVVIVPRRTYHQREPLEPQMYQNVVTDDSIRRDGRLLRNSRQHTNENNLQESDDEYLPPEVREMLLLKMLKLAINPALPVEEDHQMDDQHELQTATVESTQYKRAPMRNVEILGEEDDDDRPVKIISQNIGRSKRDREEDMEVME